MPTPVIIDCDPGHDDVFALWLAAGNPAIDLLGVTTVGGNGRLEHTTHNARVALTVAGVEGVPIAAGGGQALAARTHPGDLDPRGQRARRSGAARTHGAAGRAKRA
ncbi:nucleoside hydrolase [Amycolatopsis echigonensis]|uniref:nucleoside hydrolase n=1 Tax=Amycolatopsis echigonensis TaxID=2576905 RepID=UPI001FEA53ED|nr:nucleoside hydrolase [Amycolatopsis echigonensis]